MLTKILVSAVFYLFYWLCCFLGTGTDKKNLAGLRSDPDAVRKAVREHPDLCGVLYLPDEAAFFQQRLQVGADGCTPTWSQRPSAFRKLFVEKHRLRCYNNIGSYAFLEHCAERREADVCG